MKDYADEYTKSAMKLLFPKLIEELATNTAFSRVFQVMSPSGVDVTKMGRVNGRLYRSSGKLINSADGLVEISRTLRTEDDMFIKITLHRDTKLSGNYSNGYTNTFLNVFNLQLRIQDERFRAVPQMKGDFHTFYYSTPRTEHKHGTLNEFVLSELAHSFDNKKVSEQFSRSLVRMRELYMLTKRYI